MIFEVLTPVTQTAENSVFHFLKMEEFFSSESSLISHEKCSWKNVRKVDAEASSERLTFCGWVGQST